MATQVRFSISKDILGILIVKVIFESTFGIEGRVVELFSCSITPKWIDDLLICT